METIKNLAKAFIGESQARNRYTYYASIAKKEGFEEISANFTLTADQEKEHAKVLMKFINELDSNSGETIKVESECSTVLGDTIANLKSAIAGENHEHTSMYPEFADIAESEGLIEIAARLRAIGRAEKNHEEKYKKFLENLENNTTFTRTEKVYWICRNCGYIHESESAPEECPACKHPKAYFETR
ncbi:MAG: rubrerythrin family protein [Patescibacteria group bacterium]|nr:rubrerythrin family protein [Patescibacteria group bacterium]MDD4304531.1 rubrerythrin family protein [Patescibacteria group bacterium]MDD4695639.1 rubrerythrin family protein [Patescibacteria group bacterium]